MYEFHHTSKKLHPQKFRIAHDRSYSMYCACVLLSKIEEELLLSSYIAVMTTRNATAKLLSGKIFKLIRRLANTCMLFHFLHAMICISHIYVDEAFMHAVPMHVLSLACTFISALKK